MTTQAQTPAQTPVAVVEVPDDSDDDADDNNSMYNIWNSSNYDLESGTLALDAAQTPAPSPFHIATHRISASRSNYSYSSLDALNTFKVIATKSTPASLFDSTFTILPWCTPSNTTQSTLSTDQPIHIIYNRIPIYYYYIVTFLY
jgi:hypothetical protein